MRPCEELVKRPASNCSFSAGVRGAALSIGFPQVLQRKGSLDRPGARDRQWPALESARLLRPFLVLLLLVAAVCFGGA